MGGRPPKIPTQDILSIFGESSDPVLWTSEISDPLFETTDGANKRLQQLAEQGLVENKKEGRCQVWWLTDNGRERLDELEEGPEYLFRGRHRIPS